MLVTCFFDNGCDMGYIYLKPPEDDEFDDYERSKNEITKYIGPNQINIPYITDEKYASSLNQMTIVATTFKADHEIGYNTEYGNDMDEEGYIIGIELTLDHERFIDLVKNQAFKVIRIEWRNREYHLVTFDYSENVFKPENVIYKLTDNEDAFVIVQLEEPEKLGYYYTDSEDRRPIALFKALISARDDIYPLEYLLKPEFHLVKNTSLTFIDNDISCDVDALQFWNDLSEEHRERIINNVYCENCSDAVTIVDCTIYNDPYGGLLRGKCKNCGNRVARVVERD